jgi:hypothetical protein
MNKEKTLDLLIHRWCLAHGRFRKKGKKKLRREKWKDVKHLQHKIGVKFD